MGFFKDKYLRITSLFVALILTLGLSLNKDIPITVNAGEIKPKIDIDFLGVTPEKPMQGQEFKVTYEITPHPFQHNISKPKEIVLVLDKSGSMKNDNKMTNLKKAAKNFIDSLASTTEDGKTPKITNLKIGIVAYDKHGYIKGDLIEVTDSNSVKSNNISTLKNTIDTLNADGGTNIGDGLRKGAYILDKSKTDANKTIIFMADGEPTYYSRGNNTNYYTTLDTTNPSIGGSGSSDVNGYCLNYSKIIGDIIKSKQYNVFSIGYGLGSEVSSSNKKMKEIHESMGGISSGENSTFFATDSGAIDKVFEKIADTLQKSYSFDDPKLNIKLDDSITAIDGFSTVNSSGNIVTIKPIVYKLGENNWYHAEKQEIEVTVRGDKVGEIEIFKEGSELIYTDIYGNKQRVPIISPKVEIRPYEPSELEKLQVDFRGVQNGYLIGDTIVGRVTYIHPGTDGIQFNNAKFTVNKSNLPSNFEFTNGSAEIITFGTVESTTSRDYNFKINDDSNIGTDKERSYSVKGEYYYNIRKGASSTVDSGECVANVNVKRGQINVKVVDEIGQNISELATVSINGGSLSNVNGTHENDIIVFNTVPSGNYELNVNNLPDGFEAQEGENNAKVLIDYNNNVVEYTFKVKGIYKENNSNVSIQVRDSNGNLADKYDSSENTSDDLIRYDKINIKNEFNKDYKLYGDSYADIVLSGKNMNHLKYKIIDATNIENGQTPTLPEEWDGEVTVDDSAHGTINGDIRNQGGIKFPEKQGIYYVAYESGSKVENDFIVEKQGIYGPFVVENRFVLTREIENKNNTELQLNYKIQPNNIDFTDIYRTKGEIDSVGDKYVTELDIVNMQLSDSIPNELEILEQIENGAPKFNFSNNIINGQLSGSIDGRVLYTLDNTGIDKTKWKYTADDITISLKVGIGEEGLQINFGEKDGKLTYDDIKLKDDNRHKKEDYFYSANATVEESSKILSQGLFNGKTVQENASINVTSANWYTIGTRFKINSSNSVFDITLPYGAVIDEKNIYLYEATDGVINMGNKSELKVNTLNERLNISNKNNNTTLTKGEYIVVYSIKFTKDENQFVKSSIDRDRNSKLDFKIKRNPDLF